MTVCPDCGYGMVHVRRCLRHSRSDCRECERWLEAYYCESCTRVEILSRGDEDCYIDCWERSRSSDDFKRCMEECWRERVLGGETA